MTASSRPRLRLPLRALHRKLLRDVWRMRGQVLSIASLVLCGVATVVAMHGTLRSVQRERDRYYAEYRFGDLFAAGTRVPLGLTARLAAIPGVRTVSARASMAVSLDVTGLEMPAAGTVLAVPDGGPPALNRVHVLAGRMVRPASTREAVVSAGFARANGIGIGDTIGAVMDGRWRRLEVVGLGMSPEFLWELAAAGFFTADERAFGLLWMSAPAVEAAAGMRGAFNEVSLALAPDASPEAVRAAVDTLLAPYGGVGAVARSRQASNYVIEQEFRQLRIFGITIPAIFLGVAAFLLNVVLARLIATQRAELAALKAFGYTDREVATHYLGFAALAVLLGSAAGIALGAWIGTGYTGVYARYFRFPSLAFALDPASAGWAVAASSVAALGGAMFAVRAAVRLPPAEALRPESPERYHPLLLERLGLARHLSAATRMVLRTIERRPVRAAAGVLGVSLAIGMLAGTIALFDAAFYMADIIFRRAQREDVAVAFQHARPAARAEAELRQVAGVQLVEGFRAAPARLRRGAVVRTVALTGLPRDAQLRRIVDDDGNAHQLPVCGAVLSSGLADALGLRRGDTLHLELIERGGAVRSVVVAGIATELVGFNVYVERGVLDRMLGEEARVSGAYLRVDAAAAPQVMAQLKRMPAVAGASSRVALIRAWDRQMLEGIRISGSLIVAFAVIIALGVVYNGARIALSERGRELASLRVLGFSRREVERLLFSEQGFLLLAAMPLGALAGVGLTWVIMHAFQAEDHHFPMVVEPRTYLGAIGIVLAAAVMAALLMRRRLDRMDLIAVLKTRE